MKWLHSVGSTAMYLDITQYCTDILARIALYMYSEHNHRQRNWLTKIWKDVTKNPMTEHFFVWNYVWKVLEGQYLTRKSCKSEKSVWNVQVLNIDEIFDRRPHFFAILVNYVLGSIFSSAVYLAPDCQQKPRRKWKIAVGWDNLIQDCFEDAAREKCFSYSFWLHPPQVR